MGQAFQPTSSALEELSHTLPGPTFSWVRRHGLQKGTGTRFAADLICSGGGDGFWYVAVTWGSGRQERLGRYKTEAVAEERIKAQLDAWHEGEKLFRK